ncbi:MAG: restriction endonuclease subunit S [Nitrospira sp.]|nr:restriction endonuclease subunit S [Nitrospira sp.]
MIRTTNVRNGFIDTNNVRYVTEKTYKRWTRRLVPKRGDVILTREAPLGDAGKVRTDDLIFLGQRLYHFRPDPNKLDADFLLYALMAPDLQGQIRALGSGATVEHMRLGDIPSLEIEAPALSVQRRIGGILSAYDELIENNQRRIKILEEMAQSLYREWFVHFRFPGHEKVKMVPSPLGPIPQGWEVKKLGDIADLRWGDTTKTKASYVEEGFDAYSASGLDGMMDHYDFDRKGVVLSAIGANCGRTWFASGKWSCIKNTIRFWSTPESISTEFLFIATLREDFWPRRGAAQPFISQGDAEEARVVCSDQATMNTFTAFVDAALQQISSLAKLNTNLRRTRDLLLPRLLSGQIALERK